MRRLLIALLFLGFANVALAQTTLENCSQVPELAADVMRNRQVNYDIMLMINSMNSRLNDRTELLSWAEAMIDMAYSQPIGVTPEARQQQIEEFQAYWLARCESKLPQ